MADPRNRFRRTRESPLAPSLLELWISHDYDEELAWAALVDGPEVDAVGSRLSSVPREFLDERVSLTALAGDVLAAQEGSEVLAVAAEIDAAGSVPARRGGALALWLWASEDALGDFVPPLARGNCARAIAALGFRLAAVVDPAEWVSDAERRDEAVRTFLLWAGQRPAGETEEAARAMLAMRDSLQHNQALAAAMTEHQHRMDVARRLNEARAREAASRYSSE